METMCAWCSQPVKPEEQQAKAGFIRGKVVLWHADCFVKYLAHKDELMGITR